MRFVPVLTLVIFFGVNALAAFDQPRGRVEVVTTDSTKYTGRVLRASAGSALGADHIFEFAYEDLARTYTGNVDVQDSYVSVQSISKWTSKFYTEGALAKSSSADIYAIWSGRIGAHFVSGAGDTGLNFKYDEFRKSLAGSLIPSYFYSFTDDFGIGGSIFAVRTDAWSFAYSLQILRRFLTKHTVRLIGATGRTIEDAGLVAAFDSVTLRYSYDVTASWHAGFQLIDYWSTVRNEKSVGLFLEYR